MIDHSIIDSMINIFEGNEYDYISNVHKRTFPDGLDVEIFKIDSLIESYKKRQKIRFIGNMLQHSCEVELVGYHPVLLILFHIQTTLTCLILDGH